LDEIPERELRASESRQAHELLPIPVALDEIPERELRVNATNKVSMWREKAHEILVALDEIPERELREVVFAAWAFPGRRSVAFKEIPQRELRAHLFK
jgi:hypothetical protein